MTLTIDLPPEAEQRLLARAANDGVEPSRLASTLIQQGLGSPAAEGDEPNPNQSTLDMLARWAEEDTADPIDPAEAHKVWVEFRDSMNAHSTRGYPIYP